MPDLFLYKAANAPIVVILRANGEERDWEDEKQDWEMIRWDLSNDTFTEGQWLMNKYVDALSASISPDGQYFAYCALDDFDPEDYDPNDYVKPFDDPCYSVVSRVPNFTAVLFNSFELPGDNLGFLEDGTVSSHAGYAVRPSTWEIKDPSAPKVKLFHGFHNNFKKIGRGAIYPSAWEPWKDPKGRKIVVEGGKILADGEVLYDTTDHVFQPKAPM